MAVAAAAAVLAAGTTGTATKSRRVTLEKDGRGASVEAPLHLIISSKPTLTIAPRFEYLTFARIIRLYDINRPIE